MGNFNFVEKNLQIRTENQKANAALETNTQEKFLDSETLKHISQ